MGVGFVFLGRKRNMRLAADIVDAPGPQAQPAPAPAGPEMRRIQHLYSPDQIAFVLQRERSRADRQSGEFSLVMFRSETEHGMQAALIGIAKILIAHARTTDEVGYYDNASV